MAKDEQNDDLQAKPQAQNARKHGAFGYLNRTEAGEPIPVTLALVESQVLADIERDGPRERVRKQAARLGIAAELLWSYMQVNEAQFFAGLKHWGWLAGAEVRAWRDYGAMDDGDTDAKDAKSILNRLDNGK